MKIFHGVVLEEALKFSKYLEQVHVILFHKYRRSLRFRKNVFIHTIPASSYSNLLSAILYTFVSYLFIIILLIKLRLHYKINIVRADDIIRTGFPTTIACLLLRIPKVIYVAGYEEEVLKYRYSTNRAVLKILRFLERFVMLFSDHVFAVTSQLVSRARIFGAKSVSWTPSLFFPEKFTPKNQLTMYPKLRVLYAGRLERGKGVEVLIKAAKLLREEDIEFRIIGDGSLRKSLEWMVKKLGLNSIVKFLGLIPHSKMPEIYNDADVFVLPSFTEGAPVAVLEAISCGKPVIVTPVGIIPEVFKNGIDALIIPPGDHLALANAIRILKDPMIRERLAKNARAHVLKVFNSYIQQHIEAYSRIVAIQDEAKSLAKKTN